MSVDSATRDGRWRRAARRMSALLLALAACSVLAQAPSAANEQEARRKLAAVRGEIATLTERQRALDAQRGSVAAELREADRQIADAAGALQQIEQQRAAQQAELQALQRRQADTTQRLDLQRDGLAALLRSAHALGRHAPLKLLLAQTDASRIGRALGYQRYLQQRRMQAIETLLADLAELARLQQAVSAARLELEASEQQQRAALAALEQQREQRNALLARLEGEFRSAAERLTALGRDEAALQRLLEQLRDVFADIPRQLDGGESIARQRGRLARPLEGRVLAAFGGRLPDGRPSNGWLIGASAGSPVRAIAHGRVAFADWMKGYGLLLIVDHGDGFMSLYAANESLQKEIGDWVQAGDVIGSAGSSGGQPQAGLYFELRQDGKPVDPKVWLRR